MIKVIATVTHSRASLAVGMKALLVAVTCMALSVAYGKTTEPNRGALTAAVKEYLRSRGDLCVGKFAWPIDVSESDRQLPTNDAVQMPVLEQLGLVVSSIVADEHQETGAKEGGPVKRYELTEKGRKFYLKRQMTSIGPGDQPVVHSGDFCVAKLSLNKIVRWEPPETVDGHEQTTVSYTYRIAAPDWTRDPEIQRVFPRVDMLVRGAGTMQLKETFRRTNGAWVAVTPGE
jgi:hypothetical protein